MRARQLSAEISAEVTTIREAARLITETDWPASPTDHRGVAPWAQCPVCHQSMRIHTSTEQAVCHLAHVLAVELLATDLLTPIQTTTR